MILLDHLCGATCPRSGCPLREVTDPFHTGPTNGNGLQVCFVSPEVSFVLDVSGESYFLHDPVSCFTYSRYVDSICIRNEGEEQWVQHAALRRPAAQCALWGALLTLCGQFFRKSLTQRGEVV